MLQVRIELRGGFATHVGRTSFADQSGQGLNVCFWPIPLKNSLEVTA